MRSGTCRIVLFGATLVVPLLVLLTLSIARPSTASAHPLGNFTINRYSRLDLYSDVIRIRYVLDMAEIPTFQEMGGIDRDGDGQVSEAEKEIYLAKKAEEIRGGLHLLVNGSPSDLDVLSKELSFPPGQGGLVILRLSLLLEAPAAGSRLSVDFRDDNYADRIGWKEIVVRAADGVTLTQSTAPADDVTEELRAYPDNLLSSPLDVREASFTFVPGTGAAAPVVQATAAEPAGDRPGNAFASLISISDLSLAVLLVSLLAALGFGALHALEPGHGKTFVAAYFVGIQGTAKQAVLLGMVVAATHTTGVFAIGLVTLYGSSFILPEQLYPWLSLASGLLVVGLGLRLLASRLKGSHLWGRAAHGHAHHRHAPDSHHGHSHEARAKDGSPLPWRSLLALGLADGLVPSPSTLVVLLAAISLHRVGLGLLLIVAFSVGLAAVLTLVSLILVYARRLLDWLGERGGPLRTRHPYVGRLLGSTSPGGRLLRALPVGGALVLVSVGLLLTVRALSQPGMLI